MPSLLLPPVAPWALGLILDASCPFFSAHAQSKYKDLMADPAYIDGILESGAEVANETAQRTLDACKDAMGFVVPRRR